jgi:sporulation and spore germination protein
MIPRHVQIALALLLVIVFVLGFYGLRLKRRMETVVPSSDSRPVAPPVSGAPERLRLFVAYNDDGVIRERDVNASVPPGGGDRAREVLRTLLAEYTRKPSSHPIDAAADVREVFLLRDGTAIVDTNAAFAVAHPSGILDEELTLASMVETLAQNVPGIVRVKFVVDGKERETLAGHADLSRDYDVAEVHDLVRAMQ